MKRLTPNPNSWKKKKANIEKDRRWGVRLSPGGGRARLHHVASLNYHRGHPNYARKTKVLDSGSLTTGMPYLKKQVLGVGAGEVTPRRWAMQKQHEV